jgi:hypothetical protein
MAFTVFVSHSMRPADLGLINQFCAHLKLYGIQCYMAERDWKFGASLTAKIEEAIKRSECVLAFLTKDGAASAYVNQEIGIAHNMRKPIIPIVEKGATLQGLQVGTEYVELDREQPGWCATMISARLAQLSKDKDVQVAIAWGVLGVVAALVFRH